MNMTYLCLEQHGKLNLINRLNLNLGNVICLCLKGERKKTQRIDKKTVTQTTASDNNNLL